MDSEHSIIENKKVRPKCKIWLEIDKEVIFGGGRMALFQAIDECGSINQAAIKLGMSYRAAWGKINATEKRLGIQLVEKYVGGARRGSELTPKAKELMSNYQQFKKESISTIDQLYQKYFDTIF